MKKQVLILGVLALSGIRSAHALTSYLVKTDLSKVQESAEVWKDIKPEALSLTFQPMINPRPATTTTSEISVQSINDGKWISFRIRWKDLEKSEAGKPGEFSDAVALQFPVKEGPPPPIFMGGKGQPVHLYHWRAQYQYDMEKGKKEMKDIYPNMNIDMYPMEFKDKGNLKNLTAEKQEQYSHGKAAGNPQSYNKHGIDEIFAEGFGTSAVIENVESYARGEWKNGEWTVVIGRPMKRENASNLDAGREHYMAFAVWQGGKDEVGSRKSLTMTWVPLEVKK